MIETIITSKTRIKLLIKFFVNATTSSYLRNLAKEFGESSNSIRVELNRFEEAGLLNSELKGNRKYYKANENHPLYDDLKNIIHKYIGLDKVIENVARKAGDVKEVYLMGSLTRGIDEGLIQIIIVGDDIDQGYVSRLTTKVEKMINRKISFICFGEEGFENFKEINNSGFMLIWDNEK